MTFPAQHYHRLADAALPLASEQRSYSNPDKISAASPAASQRRPNLVKRETDQILSYYQSELAGHSYDSFALDVDSAQSPQQSQTAPCGSPSSEYSSDSRDLHQEAVRYTTPPKAQLHSKSRHTRRPSVPSEGGADRRRLAIVEMDPSAFQSAQLRDRAPSSTNLSTANSDLLSRRGIRVDGLALVAPPDASFKSYTDLTPPTSAPIIPDRVQIAPPVAHHQRAASEAVRYQSKTHLSRKTSRDIGIVGTGSVSSASESLGPISPTSEEFHTFADTRGLKPPVFQTPSKSRTPSPGRTPAIYDQDYVQVHQHLGHHSMLTPAGFGVDEAPLTPAIGEGKDVRQPVVGPVVVQLSPDMLNSRQTLAELPSPATASTPGLTSSPTVYSPAMPSSYRYYEPGVHSIAGPLPPPPIILSPEERTPPPPRPPRLHGPVTSRSRPDIAAIREALQLPQSVSAALAQKLSSERVKVSTLSIPNDSLQSSDRTLSSSSTPLPTHVREGAFPPSTILSTSSLHDTDQTPRRGGKSATDQDNTPRGRSETYVPTQKSIFRQPSVESHSSSSYSDSEDHSLRHQASLSSTRSPSRAGLELRRDDSWVSLHQEAKSPASLSPHLRAASPSSVSHTSLPPTPSPPSKSSLLNLDQDVGPGRSTASLRAALLNLKRFSSLPRTPSRSSLRTDPSPEHSISRTPSPAFPPYIPPIPVRPRRRIKAAWPLAMQCHDVLALKSPLERSKAYAEKINDLAMYDCGLAEWVMHKHRGPTKTSGSHSHSVRWTMTPATPSNRISTYQPRHTSHSSMGSEATFPVRPDAYTATDLAARPCDIIQTDLSPSLPYPALAQARQTANRSSTLMPIVNSRSLQLPLSSSRASPAGFFSSLGRKTSAKKEKGALSAPGSPGKLTKLPPTNTTVARPAQLQAAPSVPGGPRAAPGRMQRAQTFSISPTPPASEPAPMPPPPQPSNSGRQSVTARRGSIFARARGGPSAPAASSNPEFEQQVDKLHVLLPHADREILAGYLRKTGQDVLAIGQYIEDEKNGTLKRY